MRPAACSTRRPGHQWRATTTEGLTTDSLLAGRVRLRQPRHGYRVAIDPVLLAAAVPALAGQAVLDAGLGTGAATLCLLARVPGCRVAGIELQPELAELAAENAALNGVELELVTGDLLAPPPELRVRSFDHVMSNPPFLEPGEGSASPLPQRMRAHGEGSLYLWLEACLRRLAPGGWLTLIHRADRLDRALAALAGRVGSMVVLPLWPAAGEPARRVIVAGRKGARGALRLLPGLVLHEADGGFTPAAQAVLRDGAPLALPH
jgi:tRNA1(Val) A37 N6-methylase TrmN6